VPQAPSLPGITPRWAGVRLAHPQPASAAGRTSALPHPSRDRARALPAAQRRAAGGARQDEQVRACGRLRPWPVRCRRIVQSAVVSGLKTVVVSAVPNARRGVGASPAVSRPSRPRKPLQIARAPRRTSSSAPSRPTSATAAAIARPICSEPRKTEPAATIATRSLTTTALLAGVAPGMLSGHHRGSHRPAGTALILPHDGSIALADRDGKLLARRRIGDDAAGLAGLLDLPSAGTVLAVRAQVSACRWSRT